MLITFDLYERTALSQTLSFGNAQRTYIVNSLPPYRDKKISISVKL